jgi:hypothetical protein
MFGSNILDVAIGLVFIYCLYSLLASTIKEIIASLLSLRSKTLEAAIKRMLTDTPSGDAEKPNHLFEQFFNNPLVKYMGKANGKKPSYIDPQNFSKTIVDIIASAGSGVKGLVAANTLSAGLNALEARIGRPAQPNINVPQYESETITLLRSFLADANNDVAKFRAALEKWFNDTMDRTSGWYKRKVQLIIFIIGLALAAAFNASTFTIVGQLSKDPKAREQLAQMASSYVGNHRQDPSVTKTDLDSTTIQKMDSLVCYADSLYRSDISKANQILATGWSCSAKDNHMDWPNSLLNLLGWLVTALAISLGAPFWFDTLNKLVQFRGTGPKPQATPS